MTTNEAARLRLFEQARDTWGDEAASTLMDALPRDPDRFATKEDLTVLNADLRGEMDRRFAEQTRQIAAQTRQLVFTIVASNATLAGLVLAAVRLG